MQKVVELQFYSTPYGLSMCTRTMRDLSSSATTFPPQSASSGCGLTSGSVTDPFRRCCMESTVVTVSVSFSKTIRKSTRAETRTGRKTSESVEKLA
ncbi:unnamed protein product [Amoebophrya sp. A25]|nr:unnamed protein product [Amoebophrya sp. A25]|eukprot:GSA25T00015458001.1